MPAPQMFPPKHDPYVLTIRVTNNAYDLWGTVTTRVDVEMTDGLKATLAQWERGPGDLDRLPEIARDLVDAMLWGDGLRSLITTVQSEDRSAQSRKVRRAIQQD